MTRSLHTPDYAALIGLLVETRKERGLTQQDVADELGKPQSYVAKVEGGERRLDVVEFIACRELWARSHRRYLIGLSACSIR